VYGEFVLTCTKMKLYDNNGYCVSILIIFNHSDEFLKYSDEFSI